MSGFASFSFLSRVPGVYVLGLGALVALVLLGVFGTSDLVSLCGFGIVFIMVLAIAWRVVRGGDQGTTDVQVTRDGVQITNIPLNSAAEILRRALGVYIEQHHLPLPMPKPVGIVTGNPSEAVAVHALPSAELPKDVIVAEDVLPIPADAREVSIGVAGRAEP